LFVQEYPCVGFYLGESRAPFCADEREDTSKQKLESNWKRHRVYIKTDRAAIWASSPEL